MLREITFDSKKIPAFLDGAINAMALYKQTGIINKFDKCTVTAPIDYTTTGYGTITFNDGAIVICGRVVYIEAGTTLAIPITTTAGGSIGVKVDLNQNAGSQVAFYSKTTQTLTQQDLNENRADGIYEFEIFKYTSNGTTLTLTYQTASVFDSNEININNIIDANLDNNSIESWKNTLGIKLYLHTFTAYSNSYRVSLNIITRNSTPFTISTLSSYLLNRGNTGINVGSTNAYPCSGRYTDNYSITGIYRSTDSQNMGLNFNLSSGGVGYLNPSTSEILDIISEI